MNKKRLNYIDLIESIAILSVLIYHCTLFSFDFESDSTIINYSRYFLQTILSTCVPLFFFINGYLLLNRDFNLKKHISKCIRLVILTFIWSSIIIILTIFIKQEYLSIKEIILKMLYLESGWTNSLWYLGALVSIYVFFPLLKTSFDYNKKAFISFSFVCIILTFGVTFINHSITIIGALTPLKISNIGYPIFNMFNPFKGFVAYALAYFCIGGLIYLIQDKIYDIPKLKRNVISSMTILLSCIGLFILGLVYSKYVDTNIWDVVWNGYDSIFTLINTICIYVLALNYKSDYKLISTISKNTLGIYFVHGIIIKLTKTTILSINLFNNVLGNFIYAIIVLFISLGTVLLIKKTHILKKLV